ncbi:hypothetical protein AB0M79_35160 [Polymorphospora sp. NPDC051019]|uniref:hypothetical protein n=1 Tax=Polymorphospora sp. NPDC051019 TaxID=3155725 RepID=UPI00342117E8
MADLPDPRARPGVRYRITVVVIAAVCAVVADHKRRARIATAATRAGSPIRPQRTMAIMPRPVETPSRLARLVQGDEDAIREVIHRYNRSAWPAWTLASTPDQ